MVRIGSALRLGLALLVAGLGCGRLGFDEGLQVRVVADSSTPRGTVVLAASPDGAGFAIAWNELPPGRTTARWMFAVAGPEGEWLVDPVELFEDRAERVEHAQLQAIGDRWILSRRYDYLGAKAPIDLAVLDGNGAVIKSFEDTRTWFASAQVVPHATGFRIFYHHHIELSDSNNYRQVFLRDYDTDGAVTQNQTLVDETLDDQLLLAAAPVGTNSVVAWRDDVAGARFATLDASGTVTSAAVGQVTDMYWAPQIFPAAGRTLFVRSSTAGVRVHRMESNGQPSWTPFEVDLPLGLNRFESRTWSAGGDDLALYVAWESDVATDLPSIAVARIDATGTMPVFQSLDPITDGTALDFNPIVAVTESHYAVAFAHEKAGKRSIAIAVRPR